MTLPPLTSIREQLSTADKVKLLTGKDFWTTHALPEHGIGSLKVSDGPVGVRGDSVKRKKSLSFPCPAALGATWNPDLVGQVGEALGRESMRKSVSLLLGPTINLQRTPIGGRNFECYSEDPLLTAELAVSMVNGIQATPKVGACIKHFICNDQEYDRHHTDVIIDEVTLRELYLYPFEQVIARAKPWAVMSSYNKVNGEYAGSNPWLLQNVLREEWKFDGIVISDWFANLDDEGLDCGVMAGLDLEMPGPTRSWGERLVQACEQSDDILKEVDAKVLRILEFLQKAGRLSHEPLAPEGEMDVPEERALTKQVAQQAAVLVKNVEQTLPLNPKSVKRLAVIGPAALISQTQGGGSAKVIGHDVSNLMDGITQYVNDHQADYAYKPEVVFAQGCRSHKWVPMPSKGLLTATIDGAGSGFSARFFEDEACTITLLDRRIGSSLIYLPAAQPNGQGELKNIQGMHLQGFYHAKATGTYTFGLMSSGYCRLQVNGHLLIDNYPPHWQQGEFMFERGSKEQVVSIEFEQDTTYEITIEYERTTADVSGIRLGIDPPQSDDLMQQAVDLAASCDACILALGTSDDWESEGSDRTSMALPGRQDELVAKILAVQPNAIVTINAAAPVNMPWLAQCKALLWGWFGGQEHGNALADILFGKVSPSGRMPLSFPAKLEDSLVGEHYPGSNSAMPYSEKQAMGYRWYASNLKPSAIAFGHGLSYANVVWEHIKVDKAQSNQVNIELKLSNTSLIDTQETVQVYIRHRDDLVHACYLKTFAKVELIALKSQQISLSLDVHSFQRWDVKSQKFVLRKGAYDIQVARSATNIESNQVIEW